MSEAGDRPVDIADVTLATLLSSPDIFASVANEIGLGRYLFQTDAAILAPGTVSTVQIQNPPRYLTLIMRLRMTVSSPVVQMQIIKDNVPQINVSGFSEYNDIVPNLYTPIRNSGQLIVTNLSGISSPSFTYYLQLLQIQAVYWQKFRNHLQYDIMRNVPGAVLQRLP